MESQEDHRQSRHLRRAALLGGGAAVFIGILGMSGWIFRLPVLASIHPSYIPIAFSTCAVFLIQGAALIFSAGSGSRAIQRALTPLVAVSCLFGLLAMVKQFSGLGGLDFEGLLFSSKTRFGSIPLNRMSPFTGGLLCASGMALLVLLRYRARTRATHIAVVLAGFTAMAGLVWTLSYLYRAPLLYGGATIPMALPTVVGCLFLGGGLLAAFGSEGLALRPLLGGSVSATLLRTFIPLAFVAVIASDILQHMVGEQSSSIVSALSAVLFGTVTVAVVARAARVIGKTIEDAEAERNRSQNALLESRQKFEIIFENAKDGIALADIETGKFRLVNPAFCEMLGYTCDELGRMGIGGIHPESELPHVWDRIEKRTGGELIGLARNVPTTRKNGTVFYTEVNAIPILLEGKRHLLALFRDITERKLAEEALRLSLRSLQIVHKHREIGPLLREFVSEIKNSTGCGCVGIRVLDKDGNIPYQAYDGFSPEFYDSENPLSIKSDRYMCINVITGKVDARLPFYTPWGSFYTNASSRFLSNVSEDEKGRTRNRCNAEGYESVALVPIRKGDRIHGLIHVADGRENMLPPSMVERLEESAMQLGAAFEKIQAEDSLRESEERFRSIFEGSSVGMVISDPDGRVLRANRLFCKILGYSEDELLGMSFFDFTYNQDREMLREGIDELIHGRTGALHIEKRCLRKNGDIIWTSVHASAIRDAAGSPLFLAVQSQDITEHREAREKIEHLNRVLRAIRDVNQLITQEKDPQRLIERSCRILVEAKGCRAAMLTLTDEAGAPGIHARAGLEENFDGVVQDLQQTFPPLCCIEERLSDGIDTVKDRSAACPSCLIAWEQHPGDTISFRLLHGCKLYGYLTVSVPPGYSRGEEERALFLEMAGDVAFALHNIELEAAAGRAEKERLRTEAQLREAQKMEALGTLAGGIAHDFNNILGIIVGYTEMALWETAEGKKVDRELGEVLKSADRARELVKQILAFSRHSKQEKKPVQIRLIVREVLNLLRASLPSTIEIRKQIDSGAVVLADPTQIHQVLMNLCTNASHAMGDNGGTLDVILADVSLGPEDIVSYSGLEPGAYVRLTVKDTGHGIDPAIMDRIFNPFFTTKETGAGTGLGLSVVHGIVKSHGGSIEVESTPGKGASFHLLFPVIEDAAVLEAPKLLPLPTGCERILVVDDEPVLALVMKEMLEHLGYEVEYKTSSLEALRALSSMPAEKLFDLVITDMTMPDLTGAELVGELHLYHPKLPVILCTGFSEKIDANKAKSLGVAGFLMKPVDLRELAVLIRRVLERGSEQ